MSTTTTAYRYLAPNPKSAYKQLFVAGTRIPARALYGWYKCAEPMSPEEIAEDYRLPLEAVREAIAYCESDPPELAQDYARQEALIRARGMDDPGFRGTPRRITPQERHQIYRS